MYPGYKSEAQELVILHGGPRIYLCFQCNSHTHWLLASLVGDLDECALCVPWITHRIYQGTNKTHKQSPCPNANELTIHVSHNQILNHACSLLGHLILLGSLGFSIHTPKPLSFQLMAERKRLVRVFGSFHPHTLMFAWSVAHLFKLKDWGIN